MTPCLAFSTSGVIHDIKSSTTGVRRRSRRVPPVANEVLILPKHLTIDFVSGTETPTARINQTCSTSQFTACCQNSDRKRLRHSHVPTLFKLEKKSTAETAGISWLFQNLFLLLNSLLKPPIRMHLLSPLSVFPNFAPAPIQDTRQDWFPSSLPLLRLQDLKLHLIRSSRMLLVPAISCARRCS